MKTSDNKYWEFRYPFPLFGVALPSFAKFLPVHNAYNRSVTIALEMEVFTFGCICSIDELVKFDAPAAIDKVLEVSGANGTYWVGHSQGTAVGYMTLAERPEYNGKVTNSEKSLFNPHTLSSLCPQESMWNELIFESAHLKLLCNLICKSNLQVKALFQLTPTGTGGYVKGVNKVILFLYKAVHPILDVSGQPCTI